MGKAKVAVLPLPVSAFTYKKFGKKYKKCKEI
jgi:hypothetical protein